MPPSPPSPFSSLHARPLPILPLSPNFRSGLQTALHKGTRPKTKLTFTFPRWHYLQVRRLGKWQVARHPTTPSSLTCSNSLLSIPSHPSIHHPQSSKYFLKTHIKQIQPGKGGNRRTGEADQKNMQVSMLMLPYLSPSFPYPPFPFHHQHRPDRRDDGLQMMMDVPIAPNSLSHLPPLSLLLLLLVTPNGAVPIAPPSTQITFFYCLSPQTDSKKRRKKHRQMPSHFLTHTKRRAHKPPHAPPLLSPRKPLSSPFSKHASSAAQACTRSRRGWCQ